MNNIELMESIYRMYYNKIKDYLNKNLLNNSILEDATQEVFKQFFKLLLKEEIVFSTNTDFHIQQILYFLSYEFCYYYKKSKTSVFFKKKKLKTLNKTIEKELNERYRDMLTLHYIKHYDIDTIIEIMHLKDRVAYKNLLHRAKEQLSKLIILLLLLITWHTTTYAVRKIYLVVKENYTGNGKDISYILPNSRLSKSIDLVHYVPTYIPDYYRLIDRSYTKNHNLMIYNNNIDTIAYIQIPALAAVSIDNNFKRLEKIEKKNIIYYFMNNKTTHLLLWSDGVYQYQLISKLRKKELLKIAKSLEIE